MLKSGFTHRFNGEPRKLLHLRLMLTTQSTLLHKLKATNQSGVLVDVLITPSRRITCLGSY